MTMECAIGVITGTLQVPVVTVTVTVTTVYKRKKLKGLLD